MYILLLKVELNYGGNVSLDVRSKDGINQMNASITMQQAGQSKNTAETRLLFKERKTIFLKMCVHFFGTPVYTSGLLKGSLFA
jgi:hypothetical protein